MSASSADGGGSPVGSVSEQAKMPDLDMWRTARLLKRVSKERRREALPGGAFGTYWDGGSLSEREEERKRLMRRWDEMRLNAEPPSSHRKEDG